MMLALPPQFLPEPGAHDLAARKTIQVKLLVGGMRIVIRQSQSQQKRISAEDLLEDIYDGDRAALAQQDWFVAKGVLERALRATGEGAIRAHQVRFGAVTG